MDIINQALQLKDQDKINDAIQLLQEYQRSAGEDERIEIAQLFQDWGLMNDAIAIYEDMLLLYPEDSHIKLLLAEIYTDIGDDEKVIELMETIRPEEEAYVPALVQLADLYQTQGLFEVSEQKLLEAKDISPNEPIIDLALAELAFSNGEFQKAIPYYERIERMEEEVSIVNVKERLAESLSSLGNWEEALRYYEMITLDHPDQLFKYGYTAYQLERYQVAIEAWRKLLEIDQDYTSVYPLLATSLHEEGAVQEAFEALEQGIQKDEFNNELYLLAAEYAVELGNRKDAESYLKQSLSLDPGFEEAAERLLELYEDDLDYEAANDLLDELLSYEAYPDILLWRKAQVSIELELFDQAKQAYEKAYPSFKEQPDFLKEYGYFMNEEGNREQSLSLLEAYLTFRPEDEEVSDFVSRLTNE
ncbi:tetratricopeptide repeat protein [Allobacillus sp. GCM10007491]|nr:MULTISPECIES: tetratricopeptide repeat protein [Allobacillus]MBR7553248.1 tetratricopeptide repeat protein [Allobacillus saliphilus]